MAFLPSRLRRNFLSARAFVGDDAPPRPRRLLLAAQPALAQRNAPTPAPASRATTGRDWMESVGRGARPCPRRARRGARRGSRPSAAHEGDGAGLWRRQAGRVGAADAFGAAVERFEERLGEDRRP